MLLVWSTFFHVVFPTWSFGGCTTSSLLLVGFLLGGDRMVSRDANGAVGVPPGQVTALDVVTGDIVWQATRAIGGRCSSD